MARDLQAAATALARTAGQHLARLRSTAADAAARDPRIVQVGLGAGAALLVGGLAYYLTRPASDANGGERVADANGSGGRAPASSSSSATSSALASAARMELSKYEKQILGDLVEQESLVSDFGDIGGLDETIRTIEELVIFPLSHPHLYAHSAAAGQPTGVLLYGPPGTGKTLLAKAVAKTASAAFLNVNVAHIQSKWFGETPKLVEAVFTLARKVSPCVVFVDEIDGVLSARNDMDMQHVNTMKTKFMECWDGLTTPSVSSSSSSSSGSGSGVQHKDPSRDWVLVIGATNKPWALDPAVLRRMPRQLYVGLPDASARSSILRVLLRGERVDPAADLERVAQATEGYSGSDLRELVRAAALIPIREEISAQRMARKGAANGSGSSGSGNGASASGPRPLSTPDLMAALQSVKPTGVAASQYRFAQAGAANGFSVDAGRGKAAAGEGEGEGEGEVAYVPSHSMRLNTQQLASAVEDAAGLGKVAGRKAKAVLGAADGNRAQAAEGPAAKGGMRALGVVSGGAKEEVD